MKSDTISDGLEPASTQVAFMLAPMLNLYRRNIDFMVQSFGISAGQSPLLSLLNENDGQNQKDLAHQLYVKPSSLTSMLNRMEAGGLVYRRRGEEDRRYYQVFLTQKGKRVAQKIRAVVRFVDERNLAGFRSEEKLLFLRFMKHMADNMDKQKNELMLLKADSTGYSSAPCPDPR